MKYIRTTDGRISYLSSEPNGEITDYEIITSKGTITYRREDEVVKVADTIEELCDNFVAYHKTLKLTYCIKPTPFEKQDENFNIYGAIWTDKGLIYVAKMNEKGELCLL